MIFKEKGCKKSAVFYSGKNSKTSAVKEGCSVKAQLS
jgi:hypothetical protein